MIICKGIKNEEDVWTKEEIIKIGEMKVRSQLRETAENALARGEARGIARGIAETMIQNVKQLIKQKYGTDESDWLSTKTTEQLHKILLDVLSCDALDELKQIN